MEYIKLDGNYGEGGGSIVRQALALSTITGKPFEVDNIRKGRKVSGLKPQHLFCIKALEELCNAEVEGVKIGSEYIKFKPNEINAKNLNIDIGTAGSITLLMQSLLLPGIFAKNEFKIKLIGGTDVEHSQPMDYFINVLLPQLKKYADIDVEVKRRGYYPKGNGNVEISIKPLKEKYALPINLATKGKLIEIKGMSHCSKDLEKADVAERQAKSARHFLNEYKHVNIDFEYCNTLSTGSGITLWAIYDNGIILGADCLGERGKSSEKVGEEAAKNLIKEINSNAAVDKYLADQLIPFMALYDGIIKTSEITNHLRSNIYVAEKFLPVQFIIDENEKTVECRKI